MKIVRVIYTYVQSEYTPVKVYISRYAYVQ